MATSAGLPESLGEFLDVWCGDLLGALDDQERHQLVNGIHLMCEGGVPWPTRLHVQRLVELAQGRITEDAVQGELLDMYAGGVEGALARLGEPGMRATALNELGQFQPTVEMVRKVTAAYDRGELSNTERVTILRRAMRLPVLPDPVALPGHLVAVPPGYPTATPPTKGRHGPVRHRSARLTPVMVSYVPQRVDSGEIPVQEPSPDRPWVPLRHDDDERAEGSAAAPFHDGVDAFLRSRGWFSRRDEERGTVEHDEWIWPPSEDDPWWQPTIIDFDGVRFRVRLASASLMEEPKTQYLADEAEVRQEIAAIEEWSA